jgi:glycosyltransferase involved in cell wall biosynthesis
VSNKLARKNLAIAPTMAFALNKNIRKFDIIHLHEYISFQAILVHHYAEKYNTPYILQVHGSIPKLEKKRRKQLYELLFGYKLLKKASKVIALTGIEAEQYRNVGIPEDKIVIIPNGIDFSQYKNLPPKGSFKKKYGIKDDEKVVLYLGRIHRSKGIGLLIKSFAKLVKMLNNVKLVLVGPDSGFLNEALSLSKTLKLESKILFTGFVSTEEKLEALADANVFVTPSFYGFPITFLEACTAGVPIVITTLGDTLSWINGRVGFVSPATPEDLSRAIYKILSSNEIYEKFSKNCKDIVRKEFSIEKVVSKLEDLYQNIIY